MNKILKQWVGLLASAAIIGLTIGIALWLYNRATPDLQNANANANQSVGANPNSSVDQTSVDGEKEILGDKLAETVVHLREQQLDLALQTLREAEIVAERFESGESESARRNLNFTNDIKQIQISVEQNEIDRAAAAIDDLLDRLNMPLN